MASGHDSHDDHAADGHDDQGHDDHRHDDHGHDDHHDDHGSGGDAWVLPPLLVGFIVGVVLIVVLGLGTDAAPFVH